MLRSFLVFVGLVACWPARAGERCHPPDAEGDSYCEVGIPSERLEPVTAQQKMSQWCWAASISMLFAFHGHPVAQERIVAGIWGHLADLPAPTGGTMSDALARPWRDDRGHPFRARIRVFDAGAGEYGLDEEAVIDELRAERPLLVGTAGHAMVVTALTYVKDPSGFTQVVSVIVRDPWPGRGRRALSWEEMEPQYVAAVDIARRPASDR